MASIYYTFADYVRMLLDDTENGKLTLQDHHVEGRQQAWCGFNSQGKRRIYNMTCK